MSGWTNLDAETLERIAGALERIAAALERVFPPGTSQRKRED